MITLGGVTLDDNMEFLERYKSQGLAMSVRRTLGGKPILYLGQLTSGFPITLESTESSGWMTKAVIVQLIALADVVGAVYELVHNGVSRQVVFDASDGPAVDMRPLIARTADADGDYFVGQIKLLTV